MRARLAREGNFSEHVAQQALNVDKADPALLDEVIQGKKELREAAKEVRKDKAAAKPVSARESAERATFDLEREIKAAMPSVDMVLEVLPDEHRDIFLRGMIETLNRML